MVLLDLNIYILQEFAKSAVNSEKKFTLSLSVFVCVVCNI